VSEVASGQKVAYHAEKLRSYLSGKRIFPATIELDVTSRCTRTCRDCPSSRSPKDDNLSLAFVRELFGLFKGETQGLLMTGGEPTISPDFPAVLQLARESGFVDIAVVTNGSRLSNRQVTDALLAHASTIRVSMYDWEPEACGIATTLRNIEELRHRIESARSCLQIGISTLTSAENVDRLVPLAETLRGAGAHWIYFHPMCTGWDLGCPQQVNQTGVLDAIAKYRETLNGGFQAFVSSARYQKSSLHFSAYHAAHFLMILGADAKNYLGAEVKYQRRHILADLAAERGPDILWSEERLGRIAAHSSSSYPALGSRHRGVLYSHFIEALKQAPASEAESAIAAAAQEYRFPHIL